MDGCEFSVLWDLSNENIRILAWASLIDWLHHFGLGEVEFKVEQQISEDVLLSRLLFNVWDPSSASRAQIGPAEEFWDMYIVPSAYGFTFDSHVHDLFKVHNSIACVT